MGNTKETKTVLDLLGRRKPSRPPIPFDDQDVKDRWWEGEDPGDSLLPSQKGFITDFIYHWRRSEIPTIFGIWTALFTISSAIKREAWIDWLPDDPIFANLYVFLVAPPAACKKSTAINAATKLIENLKTGLKSDTMRKLKKIFILNTATGEKLNDTLATLSGRKIHFPNGSSHDPGCPIVIAAPELATFLGKQKYNEGKIATLLNIYDTGGSTKIGTMARDWKTISKPFTNMIGATTKSGLKDSIPAAALGDGFLSRTVIIYQKQGTRRRAKPKDVEGAPSRTDLINRLGWIAENTIGCYTFSEEADERFGRWYEGHRNKLDALGEDGGSYWSRFDIHIRKVAFLLRAQRYTNSKTIDLCDVEDAIRIVENTTKSAPVIVDEISGSDIRRGVLKAESYIQTRGSVKRSQLMQNCRLMAEQLDKIVEYLAGTGRIEIWYNGKQFERTWRKTSEIYKWIGDKTDEED